jgi:D-proline reductase (dithiol) PrdB
MVDLARAGHFSKEEKGTMAVEYQDWVLSPSEQEKFKTWISRIMVGHTGTRDMRNQQVHWTPLNKPLSEAVVTLVTTGGVHLKSHQPFDIANPHGDPSLRVIPTDIDTTHLTITHSHYNHVDADRDINCMFPLDRLRELCDQGVIGGIAHTAYSIMGFNPDPTQLMEETAPEIARRVQAEGPDLVFMTCG